MIPAPAIKLNEADYRLVPIILKGFRRHVGKDARITSAEIISRLRSNGCEITDATLRRVIGFIRRHELAAPGFILSDSRGYWYSENKEEAMDVWDAQYSRALEIIQNFSPILKRYNEDTNQLKIDI
jgi:hypothetical protein